MASSSADVRSWRTAFLTLRDETLTSPPPSLLHSLVRDLILSQSDLTTAALDLPPHEVTSDVILLVELAAAVLECGDAEQTLLRICHLICDVSCKIRLTIDSSSWTIMLKFLGKMLRCKFCSANIKAMSEILEVIRLFAKAYRRNISVSESMLLVETLLCVVSCLHSVLLTLHHTSGKHLNDDIASTPKLKCNSIWEMQATSFSLIGVALSRIGSSISENLWQKLVEVLRKVMDFLASKNLLLVDNVMSRFYNALLHCLHLVLADPKGSLSGQVTGFGATLQMFLTYGLSSRSPSVPVIPSSKERVENSLGQKPLLESRKSSTYVPPHLRRRERTSMQHSDAQCSSDYNSSPYCLSSSDSDAQSSSDYNSSPYGLSSSDSDFSDTDGYLINGDRFRSSKIRVAAIACIQDLCHAEPKSLTSVWTLFLPENDVLMPRKYQATLMTCLLFDPVMKIRMASASTLASMLDGHSSTFLQVAEHKGSNKCGSFITLSSSLGQILMQLHTGIMYLIQHERHSELLASSFKILMLLISATPYARMPENLLSTLIEHLFKRISSDLACKIDHSGIQASALSCLGAALSVSPPSAHVLKMLEEDISRGPIQSQQGLKVLSQLIQFSEEGGHPTARFEALQVLRAVSHNYPSIVPLFWESISATVYRLLELSGPDYSSHELYSGSWKGDFEKFVGSTLERCIMAAVKALDECLRAASGFKGASDLDCGLLYTQLIADCTREKKISSAPSYELGASSSGYFADFSSGSKKWCEVIEKHLPLAFSHRSPMVRAAAVTCFAGMTSEVFFSLGKDKQQFVITCAVSAALNEGVSSVRSAACRAIGIISCFSEIISSRRVLNELIRAVEFNSRDSSASVRITACWALANICDSLRCQATDLQMKRSQGNAYDVKCTSLLLESALRLTKDGDKIKSNAVRALGNLSRFLKFSSHSTTSNEARGSLVYYDSTRSSKFSQSNVNENNGSATYASSISKSTLCLESHWLEIIVHAFVSCVTTGNVKVQWNVCHALSNLFMNDTIKLHDMSWAPSVYSILLLLLRDATNYKIRIYAAVALAVPASRIDYGNSFCDVVQGLVHVLESLNSAQGSTPSIFKYKDNLEKQLMLTTSHVLGFASFNDDQVLKDFLVKKASLLEERFKTMCTSCFSEHNDLPTTNEATSSKKQDGTIHNVPNKALVSMVSRAIQSLLDIFECSNNQNLARRFGKLASNLIS